MFAQPVSKRGVRCRKGGRAFLLLLVALVFSAALCAQSASAAVLKANYQLQGTHASSVAGAPDLTDLGAGNAFATETVNGISRQVLTFPMGNGLTMNINGLVDPQSYSVVMLFRLTDVSSYRKLLDFANATSDDGLYTYSGDTYIYPNVENTNVVFSNNTYAELAFTVAPAATSGQYDTVAYVNGTQQAHDPNAPADFSLAQGTLRFFKDDSVSSTEDSAGAVACIRVYNLALTAAEVGQIASDHSFCPAASRRPPSNAFSFGKLKKNNKKGSATLTVNLPGAGTVSLSGAGVVTQHHHVGAAGPVVLQVIPKGKTKKKLKRKHAVTVRVSVTFTPTGGTSRTQFEQVKLVKKR